MDIRWIFRETSGIGTYTRELLRALVNMAGEHEWVLFYNDKETQADLERRLEGHTAATRFVYVPFGIFSLSNQIRMPRYLADEGIEVFHSPNYMIPFRAFPRKRTGFVRCVVTIHDVIPLKFPQYTPRARKNRVPGLFWYIMRQAVSRADAVIVVSECSRRDLIEKLHIPPDRQSVIFVVPNGVAAELFCMARVPRPESAPRTILYVGRFDPYKNVTGLVEIFHKVRSRAPFDVRLLVIGAPDPRYPEPFEKARELGIESFIEWRGHQQPEELAEAYATADVLVLPSRYEGFGLTVLEAMACGTPVVCSNRGSLPEVVGDAAVMHDPDDLAGFAEAVLKVLNDSRWAEELARRGRTRARHFTWARAAQVTLSVYDIVKKNGLLHGE